MSFTSVPTHLLGGGFFNFWPGSPTFTSMADLSEAQATEQETLEDCVLCSDVYRCEDHRFERSLRSETDDRYQIAPEDFYFSDDSTSDFTDLELVEVSEDSNIFFDVVTGEEIEEFFSVPVRIEGEDGYFVEIDPSLVESDEVGFAYETAVGEMMNFFPEVIDEATPFLLTYQDFEIRFTLVTDEEVVLSEVEDIEFIDIFEETEERPLVALYNIDEYTDFRVTSSDIGIKSEFVLDALPESNIFSYELNLTGLRAELFEDASSVLLFCLDNDEEPVAVIPEGIMWDSSSDGSYSNDIEYTLERLEPGRYILSLIVCEEYLSSPSRVFPITVDPTITWRGTFASSAEGRGFTSHWVRSGADADTVIGNTYSLPIGRGASTGRVHRSFMRGDNINATLRHRTINSATLHLTQRTAASGINVSVRRVNDPTATQTNAYGSMTWNNQPGSTEITTFSTRAARTVHNINVLSWARDVADGSRTGRGFSLRAVNTDQYAEFYGARDVHAARRPRIVVAMAAPAAPATLTISNPHARTGQAQTVSWGTIAPSQHIRRVEYRLYRNVVTADGAHSSTGTLVASGTLRNVTNGAAGSAAIPNANTLAEGCYRVRVRGVDSENVAGAWRNVYFHLDNTAPVLNLATTPITPATSATNFSNQLPTIHWTGATDAPVCDARRVSIQVRTIRPDGTTSNWRNVRDGALSHAAGSAAFNAQELLANVPGTYNLEVRALDRAGNASAVRSFTYFYDGVAPTLENVSLYPQASSGWHTEEVPYIAWQNLDDLPQFDGNSHRLEIAINREGESVPEFSEFTPQAAFSVPHTPVSGKDAVPLTLFENLCEEDKPLCGRYEVRVRAVDHAGNIGLYNNVQYWVDRIAPELTLNLRSAQIGGTIVSSNDQTHAFNAPVVGGALQLDAIIDRECPNARETSGFEGGNVRIEGVNLTTPPRNFPLGSSLSTYINLDTTSLVSGFASGIYRATFSGQDRAGNVAEPAIMYFEVQNLSAAPSLTGTFGNISLTSNTGEFSLGWAARTWRANVVSGIEWTVVEVGTDIGDRELLDSLDWTRVYVPEGHPPGRGTFSAQSLRDDSGELIEGTFTVLARAIHSDTNTLPGHVGAIDVVVNLTGPDVEIADFVAGIVRGTVLSDSLRNYQIDIKPQGAPAESFETVYSGDVQIYDCSLGFIDVSKLSTGGIYTIRVASTDISGNVSYSTKDIQNVATINDFNTAVSLNLNPFVNQDNRAPAVVDSANASFALASNHADFDWFIGGVETQSATSGNNPPTFSTDFADFNDFPEGSYHTVFGTNTSRDNWTDATPSASGTTALVGSGGTVTFDTPSSFETYSGGSFNGNGAFVANADTARFITEEVVTSLPFTSLNLSQGLNRGDSTSIYVSVDGGYWEVLSSSYIWTQSADSERAYATSFRIRVVIEGDIEGQNVDIPVIAAAPAFIAPDIFHIDFLSAATPVNFSARDRLDFRTHFFWTSEGQRPADMTYEILSLQQISDMTEEGAYYVPLQAWSRVATGVRENTFASPNFNDSVFFYRAVPTRINLRNGEVLSVRTGTPTNVATSAAADANELLKRLGSQDYWAYEHVDTPMGLAKIEKSQGNMVYTQIDRTLEADPMLQDGITRTHNSQSSLIFSFGQGTDFSYNVELVRQLNRSFERNEHGYSSKYNYIFKDSTGTLRTFVQDGENSFFTRDSKRIRLEKFDEPKQIRVRTLTGFASEESQYKDILVGYVVTSHRKREYWFSQGGQLLYITNSPGQLHTPLPEGATFRSADFDQDNLIFVYCPDSGLLQSAISRGLRTMHFAHNDQRLVSAVWLPDSSVISYTYDVDSGTRLEEVRQHYNNVSEEAFLAGSLPAKDNTNDIYHTYSWQQLGLLARLGLLEERYFKIEINGVARELGAEIPTASFAYQRGTDPVRVASAANALGDRVALDYLTGQDVEGNIGTAVITIVQRTPYGLNSPNTATRSEMSWQGHPLSTETGTAQEVAAGTGFATRQTWYNHLLSSTSTPVEYHELSEDGTVIIRSGYTMTSTGFNDVLLPTTIVECSGVRTEKEYASDGVTDEEITSEKIVDIFGNIDYWTEYEFDEWGNEVYTFEVSYELVTYRSYYPCGRMRYEITSLQKFEDGEALGDAILQSRVDFEYDRFGNAIRRTVTDYGSVDVAESTYYAFTAWGQLISRRNGLGTYPNLKEERIIENTYDRFGRQTGATSTEPCGAMLTISTEFNRDGTVAKQVDEQGIATNFAYDIAGRVVSRIVSTPGVEDQVFLTEHGWADVEINTLEGTQLYAGAQTTTSTDPAGLVTTAFKDAYGRTIRLSASGINTDTVFTECGRAFAEIVLPEDHPRSDARINLSLFDRFGNQTHAIDSPIFVDEQPKVGNESIVTSSIFDVFGREVSSTDALGYTTYFTHDAQGEMTSAALPEATYVQSNAREFETVAATVNFTNEEIISDGDDAGNIRTVTANALGYLSEVIQDPSERILAISDLGRTTFAASYDDIDPVTTIFSHNDLDQLTRTTFASGDFRAYFYDESRNLIRIEHRRANGDLELTTVNTFDSRGQVLTITDYRGAPDSQNVIYHQAFEYDVAGKRVTSFEGHTRPESITEAQKTRFHFDTADRIIGVDFPILPALEVQSGQQNTGENAAQIAVSGDFTIALQADGSLWSWGNNNLGQLGLGDNTARTTPALISDADISGDRWISVSAGMNHALALRDNGNLYAWGNNANGRLGIGTVGGVQLSPIAVASPVSGETWIEIAAGDGHSLAILSDGTLWAWGNNLSGRLGFGTAGGNFSLPTEVVAPVSGSEWTAVSVGTSHTLALRDNGQLYAWGNNANGRLGIGVAGNNFPSPTAVASPVSGETWTEISAGDAHSMAILSDRTLWAWGNNSAGRLGLGNTVQRNVPYEVVTTGVSGSEWTEVSAFNTHTAALRDSGELYVWGTNTSGQLGLGDTAMRSIPTRLPDANIDGDSWTALSSGTVASHTVAVRDDGTLWSWGSNAQGQLGKGFAGDGQDAASNQIPQQVEGLPQSAGQINSQAESIVLLGQRFSFDDFGRLDTIYARLRVDDAAISTPLRQYSYDAWGRVSELRDFNLARRDGSYILKSYTYDDFGRVINISYALYESNVNVVQGPIAELTGINTSTGSVFESFTYTFDKNHNIISERHILDIDGTDFHDELRTYTFDAVGRLTRSESTVNGVVEYGWDRAGNRRFVNDNGDIEWSDFNGLNQLTHKHTSEGVVRYFYCANGNQIREEGPNFVREFDYNVDNRLTRVRTGPDRNNLATINANAYRGDGQRIAKYEFGQRVNYVYQDGSVLFTTDEQGSPINFHLKDPAGALTAMMHYRNDGNPVSNFTTDIRQSTTTVLGSNANFLTGFRYTDFGETTRLADTYELIEIAYTGGVWDESTGLYYLNARFYNPADARFLTMDVARNGGDLRATLSLYGYTEGDPINKVDPSGYTSLRSLSVPLFGQQTPMWCGPGAAQMVIKYARNRTVSQRNIQLQARRNCAREDRGTNLWQLTRGIRNHSMRAGRVNGQRSWGSVRRHIIRARPMIAGISWWSGGGHWVVIVGFQRHNNRNYLLINNPAPAGRGRIESRVRISRFRTHAFNTPDNTRSRGVWTQTITNIRRR